MFYFNIQFYFVRFYFFFLEDVTFDNSITDKMEKGSFIMGDLNILGWVVYRGEHFKPELVDKLDGIHKGRWNSVALDTNRKYCMFQDNFDTVEMRNIFNPFINILAGAYDVFVDKVNGGGSYEMQGISVFKNTSRSDGQPDHCDYPRAHD